MELQKLRQGLRPDHGHVTGKHEQCRISVLKKLSCGIHSITGTKLLFLDNKLGVLCTNLFQNCFFNIFALIAYDDVNLLRSKSSCRAAHMVDQRTSVESMQHLRNI